MWRGRTVVPLSLTLLLVLVTASLSFALERGLGLRPPTPAEQAAMQGHLQPAGPIAPNAVALARAREETARTGRATAVGLPTAVDNSTLAAFPPIRSQGSQNSCVAWSTAFYYNTYTQARDEGYNAASGDNSFIDSPAFIYPLINGGADNGASVAYGMYRLGVYGCSSWTDMPWSAADSTTWPTETAWVNALRNRTATTRTLPGNTADGVAALKQHLANGNLAIIGLTVYSTWYNSYPADGNGMNNGVYYAKDGSNVGGHALTIVGYDDGQSYVDSRDGLTHYGAFLLANSWGTWWGTTNSLGRKGFMWIAYSYFEGPDLWYYDTNVYFNDDRPHYRPTLYAVTGINEAQRGLVQLWGAVVGTSAWDSSLVLWDDGGTVLPVDDTKPIAVDLTDGVSALATDGPSTVSVYLGLDSSAASDATIASATFYEDLNTDGTYVATSSTDPTVTIAPGATGVASALINPYGLEYAVGTPTTFPTELAWDTGGATTLTLRNLGAASWTSAGGDGLWARDDIDRWSVTSVPVATATASGASFTFEFTITAPPLTTLAYPASAGQTDPPVVAGLPVDLVMSHGTTPLPGPPLDQTVVLSRFPDIQPSTLGAWARSQVEECAGRVPFIVKGFSDGSYRPKDPVRRDQMALFLQRSLDLPLGAYQGLFTDVAETDNAALAIEACVAAGVVTGYQSDNTYRGDRSVLRDQMAVFIARGLLGGEQFVPTYTGTPTFTDLAPGDFGYNHVEYAVSQGVVKGFNDGTYRPKDVVKRDQMATFIYRAFVAPTGAVVVLGGPAVTAQDPAVGDRCGWASIAGGPAADPGYAYVVFDAARLGANLAAVDGTWQVTFELRAASAPDTPATGAYAFSAPPLDGTELDARETLARTTGVPYYTVAWPIPAGLAPGDYVLVVSAKDPKGAMREIERQPAFTITP